MNMPISPLALASANIRHRRYLPKAHSFDAKLTYLWFDPDQLQCYQSACYLWSVKRFNILQINEQDFLTQAQGSIREKVAQILWQEKRYILDQQHTIRVLSLPRSLGFRFNSVVFYFVYDQSNLVFILSEITNTPWNERQVYVHSCHEGFKQHGVYQSYRFNFSKVFHVSPFMPMDLEYRWRFSFSAHRQVVFMQVFQHGVLQFDASMNYVLNPITSPSQQYRYAMFKMFEPFRMLGGIYLNAFYLWKKKIPFYRHPKKNKGTRSS